MTEFRTKGRGINRKVYPLRRPYGVPRSFAERSVQEKRKEGFRMRLIETNRKRSLYAPYMSVLQDKNQEAKSEPPVVSSEQGEGMKNNNKKIKILNTSPDGALVLYRDYNGDLMLEVLVSVRSVETYKLIVSGNKITKVIGRDKLPPRIVDFLKRSGYEVDNSIKGDERYFYGDEKR
ncbi:MAG: hypothetical protein QXZ17_14635 [Nitrososphaerota archaeon]